MTDTLVCPPVWSVFGFRRSQALLPVIQEAVPVRSVSRHVGIADGVFTAADERGITRVKITVKRHPDRFPQDFMFQLTTQEARDWWLKFNAGLRSQNVTLKRGQHLKYRPYAFTDYGILMLSSVLNSDRAIKVNIAIMRTFVKLRRMVIDNEVLAHKLDALEQKYDCQFKIVFDAIRQLMTPAPMPPKPIGFRPTALKK